MKSTTKSRLIFIGLAVFFVSLIFLITNNSNPVDDSLVFLPTVLTVIDIYGWVVYETQLKEREELYKTPE